MNRKWESYSCTSQLMFDEELSDQSARLLREVIVHELLHLKVPNHGPLFQSLMRAYLADPVES